LAWFPIHSHVSKSIARFGDFDIATEQSVAARDCGA